jgi:hypothetical protein
MVKNSASALGFTPGLFFFLKKSFFFLGCVYLGLVLVAAFIFAWSHVRLSFFRLLVEPPALALSLSLSLSLSLTRAFSLSLALSLARSLALALSHTHTHSLSLSPSQFLISLIDLFV